MEDRDWAEDDLSFRADSDLHASLNGQNFCTFEDTRASFQAAVVQEETHGGFRVDQLMDKRSVCLIRKRLISFQVQI